MKVSQLPTMRDRCLASQGKNTPTPMHYNNIGTHNAWDLTFIDHQACLRLDIWHSGTMSWDILHNLWLGTAIDLVGSGLKTLVMQGCYDFLEETDTDSVLSYLDSLNMFWSEAPRSWISCFP